MPGSYDDRHGLRVSKTTNRTGLLVATDRRFIFVDKQIGSLKVDDLPYGKISWVESSTGWATGKITIHESKNDMIRVYEGDVIRIQRLAKHLQEKISIHAAVPTKSKSDVINDELIKLGVSKDQLGKAWTRHLVNTLEDDELPENFTAAQRDGSLGVLVATASRLIFLQTHDWQTHEVNLPEVETFTYDSITAVECFPGILFGKITIWSSGSQETFDGIGAEGTRQLKEYINAKISAPSTSTPVPTVPAPTQISVADELEKLSALADKGILTSEEFETQKNKLLHT